jgi:hypothetical protein
MIHIPANLLGLIPEFLFGTERFSAFLIIKNRHFGYLVHEENDQVQEKEDVYISYSAHHRPVLSQKSGIVHLPRPLNG